MNNFSNSQPKKRSMFSGGVYYVSNKKKDPSNAEKMRNFFKPKKTQSVCIKSEDLYRNTFEFSDKQKLVLKAIFQDRRNVFFTGSAGTGKTMLLKHIIDLIQKANKDRFENSSQAVNSWHPEILAVTASTALAAYNLRGMTLHSFAGVGTGTQDINTLIKKIRTNRKVYLRWKDTQYLVIDEISMIEPSLFDKIEAIARTIRANNKPFGGIQLILAGDFFQLPPVSKQNSQACFCFEAQKWESCVNETILLDIIYRQKDPVLSSFLNELRLGAPSQDAINFFKSLDRPLENLGIIEATELLIS